MKYHKQIIRPETDCERNFVGVTFKAHPRLLTEIDKAIDKIHFRSRGHIINCAVDDWLKYRGQDNNDEKSVYCPFCGNDTPEEELYVADISHSIEDGPFETFYCVRCDQCEASGPYGETEEEAIQAWKERCSMLSISKRKHYR